MAHGFVRHVWAGCLIAPLAAQAAGADPGDAELIRRWTFTTAADAEGWRIGRGLEDLTVADGVLRATLTHADAYLFAPPVQVPLDGCVVRVRLRLDREGSTQIYWATDDAPAYNEQRVMSRHTRAVTREEGGDPAEEFATVEFPIGTPADAGRTLTGFRIDPYNGNSEGTVEIESVELRRQPPVLEARFSADAAQVGVREPIAVRTTLEQTAGRAADGSLLVKLPGTTPQRITLPPGGAASATATPRLDTPGVHHLGATVGPSAEFVTHDLQTSVIVGREADLPLLTALRSERTRLDLVPTPDGEHVGGARWQIADPALPAGDASRWKLAGWLLPLVDLVVQDAQGVVFQRHPALRVERQTDRQVQLRAIVDEDPYWQIDLALTLAERHGHEIIETTAVLTAPDSGRLLRFACPVLRADRDRPGDPLDRFAVFGGLEFLEPSWPSSSDRAVGERFADRWAPHPFKVALPVMAVEAAGVTSSLMWQPLEKWDGTERMPTATFASPNFLDHQPNHLMTLSVPTIPDWTQENESLARTPYLTPHDTDLALKAVLHAETGLPAAMTARRWYELFGTLPAPPPPHNDRELYDLIARHYGDTMYWPKEKGWRHHWYLGTKSSFSPMAASELVAHAVETGDQRWVRRTGLEGATIIDTAGTLASRLEPAARAARARMATMQPDGTWPFKNTEHMREQSRKFTDGKHDGLGDDGSTSLGTCVQAALPILHYAELSGDEQAVAASLRALEAMRRFRVPRGAQVWEVHQQIPDIRAAALAVDAYQIGYHLTGDDAWLADATYWAWTGVPFLYSWHVPIERTDGSMVASRDRDDWNRVSMPLSEGFQNPDRQVTPFGSIPVLGPTFWVINWFGVIVQWCGLEWAWKVIELDADRPDPLLRYIADGVAASGLQQMFDRPPWVGLYPDVWNTERNIAHGAFICAMLPARCLRSQGRIPVWPQSWTRVLHDGHGRRRWHVSGWGRPVSLPPPGVADTWTASVVFPPSQPNELMLAGVDAPKSVSIAGRQLEHVDAGSTALADDQWRYDAERRTLFIRFRQIARTCNVRVDW